MIPIKRLSLLIWLTDLILGIVDYFWLNANPNEYIRFTDLMPFLLAGAFIPPVILSDEGFAYFKKHSRIYKWIFALAFLFLILGILANPTYYLTFIFIGVLALDFFLAILWLVIAQNKKVAKP
jgi:hypothetical protein